MSSRTRRRELLLILISIFFTVLVAEVVARMLNVRPHETRLERYEFDETLGWVTRKSYTTYISRRRYAHPLYYDEDGFPSGADGVDESSSPERPSIALIGDSFAEGYYLPFEQTLAYRLGQSTQKQILNLGVSGYSPSQYLLSARRHLGGFNVTDIVVFLFPFNDNPYVNLDMYRGYAKPLVSDESYEATNLPLVKMNGSESEVRGFVRNMLDNFALWSLIKPTFVFLGQGDDIQMKMERVDPKELTRSLKLIARIGVEYPVASFHVYYIPDVTELKLPDVYAYNISSFEQNCRQLELSCITPDAFSGLDPDSLYIPEDRHFSSLGTRIVADQIAGVLSRP